MSGQGGSVQIAETLIPRDSARPLVDREIGETLRAYLRSSEPEPGARPDEAGTDRRGAAWSLEPVGPALAEGPTRTPASGAVLRERVAAQNTPRASIGGLSSRAWRLAAAGLLGALVIGATGYLAVEVRAPVPIAPSAAGPTGNAPQAARAPQAMLAEDLPGLPRADAGTQNPPGERPTPSMASSRDRSPGPAALNAQASTPHVGRDAPAEPRIEDRRDVRVHPRVEAGYDALRSRELSRARDAYLEVLQENPLNRDALLGMAAIETYAHRRRQAQDHLQNLLRAEPRDPHARAALIALSPENADARSAEKALEGLLSQMPESAALRFVLGNQYARQRRWAEARKAYLEALERDPGDPDIAFNLAIASDHLGLASDARTYYERALDTASQRLAVFPAVAAQRRLESLAR